MNLLNADIEFLKRYVVPVKIKSKDLGPSISKHKEPLE